MNQTTSRTDAASVYIYTHPVINQDRVDFFLPLKIYWELTWKTNKIKNSNVFLMTAVKSSEELLWHTSPQTPSSGAFQAQMCEELPTCQHLGEGFALIVNLELGWKLTGSLHLLIDPKWKGPTQTTINDSNTGAKVGATADINCNLNIIKYPDSQSSYINITGNRR